MQAKTGIPGAKWALLAAALFGVFAQFIAAEFPDAGTLAGVLAAAIVGLLGAGAKALEVYAERHKEGALPSSPPLPASDVSVYAGTPEDWQEGAAAEEALGARRSSLRSWWNGNA